MSKGQLSGLDVNVSGVASTSRGLVGDTIFAVLPTVKPMHTFAITVAFQTVRTGLSLWLEVDLTIHCRSIWESSGLTPRISHS